MSKHTIQQIANYTALVKVNHANLANSKQIG